MLQPKRSKYRKCQKGRNKGFSINMNVEFGDFGLKSLGRGRLTSKQIESARIVINKYVKRQCKIWIRIFPDKPITKKPLEVRMGKGKGNVEYWVAIIKPGKILYEISGVTENIAKEAFRLASYKLPFKTCFIIKNKLI
ncbi:50S ribosomal protein L16 [Candidatus Nardonella dryophthoridicola]|uniref:50S ribosomal protein L16 n=1 Tax=Candidatus Nardonella dryophthoridicola TaxID=1971485 RepID=UPI001AD895C9|nr:50S ribosomal protein L16 [Candidatus Nardonella dryophthoridicola]QTJ62853.1 50S ribosomal protein L16 [Candidatus Nardonella dryophthoridicola]